jgi:hypothetical protein
MKQEKKYKLYKGFPAMTKIQWLNYSTDLYVSLMMSKSEGRDKTESFKDALKLYHKICKKFNINLI